MERTGTLDEIVRISPDVARRYPCNINALSGASNHSWSHDSLILSTNATARGRDSEEGRDERSKVLILASKFDHCLVDLLYRLRIGELRMDVVGIVSNHPRETYNGSDFGDIPFHYLPVTRETKSQQEAQIKPGLAAVLVGEAPARSAANEYP
jgi:formyltetrahydrofolate hydrolase